jgi:protein required for attachment to host cells
MKAKTRLIVADSSRARIFDIVGVGRAATFVEGSGLIHEKSRVLEQEILTDRPGRVRTGLGGYAVTAMPPRSDPKELEANRFAEQIAEVLEASRRIGEFDLVVLAAPPKFLGLLRERVSHAVRGCVGASVALDGIRMKAEELRSALAEALATAHDVALQRQPWPWAEPARH